ncbi:endonuclease [Vibrio ostreicida]|uniref:HNH endonuclease signature motif containing protein n=1 Tax=Vibrio ostreicida TaxID=526588 RepID=UPI000970399C|nr:endonuclease I [Vibrio ostreicida]
MNDLLNKRVLVALFTCIPLAALAAERNNTTAPLNCSENTLTVEILTDNYGNETSWILTNGSQQAVSSGMGYASNTRYMNNVCASSGRYVFEINDAYGDGLCCDMGKGAYQVSNNGKVLLQGSTFGYVSRHEFTLSGDDPTTPSGYYLPAQGQQGYALKTALYNIIKDHDSQGYSALWNLTKSADIDRYYEKDGTILDIYSERISGQEAFNYTKVLDQCGQYRREGECYNREHSFPKSWFGGKIEPMNSDGHHIFATDGYVNGMRGNWPYGEVGSTTYVSSNGSKVGQAAIGLGYSGKVFEPIDAYKGDLARAYFYMATRYENGIAHWEANSSNANAVLNGNNTSVFEPWVLAMLKRWHANDPVDQKERDRNNAVYQFQKNRNPYIDHPEFVNRIWGN